MRNDLTDITVVLDRSGSMSSIKTDAEGGLNSFIEKQKAEPGRALFTLVQFDTAYEFVHKGVDIQSVPRCELVPRGATALLDAIGRAIVETGERLKAMPDADRPGLVVFVILTDGQENSSREYTKAKIKEMIEHQTNVYEWQFTFLGADQDAFAEAAAIGIRPAGVAGYEKTAAGFAFDGITKNVARMRAQKMSGATVECSYTDEEREEMSKKS